MATFKTSTGEYVLAVTVNGLAAVREALGIYLAELDLGVPPLAVRLWHDVPLVTAAIYHCRKATEAKHGKVPETLEKFRDEIEPDHIPGLHKALAEALGDFFQRSGRLDLTDMLQQTREAMLRASLAGMERAAIGQEIQKLQQEMATTDLRTKLTKLQAGLKGGAGNTPASSDSTPALTPSPNSTAPPALA